MPPTETKDRGGVIRAMLLEALMRPPSMAAATGAELDLLMRVARRVRLLGTLAVRAAGSGVLERLPSLAVDQMLGAKALTEARARTVLWELDRLAWALPAEPFPNPICLKGGAYLLLGLPNAEGRSVTDVDILLPEATLEAAEARLTEAGWRSKEITPYDDHYYRAWTHELPPMVHVERDIEVDLHHNILPRTARLKPAAARLLDGRRAVPGHRFGVLSSESLVLHTMTHLMFDSDLSDALRDLVDVDALIRHFDAAEADFWPRLVAQAERLDLQRPAFYALRYAARFLETPIPADVVAATRHWRPDRLTLGLMDAAVPSALFPPDPDRPLPRAARAARGLLYARSHWIRMPPLLLARHLSYKLYVTRLKKRTGDAA